MSRIMSKLKKLEGNVKSSSDGQAVAGLNPRETGRSGIPHNVVGITITLAVVLLVGIISYVVGTMSGKGTNPHKNASGISIAESVQSRQTSNTKSVARGNTVAEDLSTIAFEEVETVPTVPSASASRNKSADAKKMVAIEPIQPEPDEPAGDAGTGDGEKVLALAAAIIKATDSPVTPEEDELNKQTVQKLNILGILKDENGMAAIISGTEVREGDKIRQFTVDEITRDYVVFSFKRTLYRKAVR